MLCNVYVMLYLLYDTERYVTLYNILCFVFVTLYNMLCYVCYITCYVCFYLHYITCCLMLC